MIVHDTIELSSQTFSPSILFNKYSGTTGFETAASINAMSGSQYIPPSWVQPSAFSNYLAEQKENFLQTFVPLFEKEKEEAIAIQYRPLETWEDFSQVPPAMALPIALMPEIRTGIESGRFAGYGFDPSLYPQEDVFGRLINNGLGDLKPTGIVEHVCLWESTDPELTEAQLEDIERTRENLRRLMEEDPTIDPTDPSQMLE